MPSKNEEAVAHLLTDVVEYARGRWSEPAFGPIESFLTFYYELVDAQDLKSRAIADLYGAAMAHWQTAQRFAPGTAVLRVYNPVLAEHGRHSDHTILEIVTDEELGIDVVVVIPIDALVSWRTQEERPADRQAGLGPRVHRVIVNLKHPVTKLDVGAAIRRDRCRRSRLASSGRRGRCM